MTEELKNEEEAKNTISPATSEHQDTKPNEGTDVTDEKNDELITSEEESKVGVDVSTPQPTNETETTNDSGTTKVEKISETAPIEKIDSENEVATSLEESVIESETPIQPTESTSQEINAEQEADDKESDSTNKLASEEDLEESHEDDEHHEEEIDYSTLNKEELVEAVKAIAKDDNVIKADKVLMSVKPFIDEIRNKERQEAKDKFIADGNEEDDFEFKHDELSNRFDANYRLIKDRKSKFFQEKEKQKDVNLKKKQELLERLREFVDSDETNISFEKFKEYQTEWKSIGMVPSAYNRTLWANYNALLNRFYDHRSIYFELKELDRKKNLEHKLELCEKAEALANEEQLNVAIKALNELHHEFKHLGPVPKADQEPLWQRFKEASDAVYAKRKDYVEHLKVAQEENLKKKLELVERAKAHTSFNSDRIKEWNEKTKEVVALQKEWESIGGMPREKAKEVNKAFWTAFKLFFHNKGDFFKALDAKREGNLEQKKVLIEKANKIKESTDWIKTTNELIKLQKQWKDIGPVPEKYRNSAYQEFKAACDHFFDQKRSQNKVNETEYVANLEKKLAICAQIEEFADQSSNDIKKLRDLQADFQKVGFVPKKDIGTVRSKYADAVDKFINAIPDITNEDRQRIRLENQLSKLANDPKAGEKIYRKEQTIRKQISKVEDDISLWKNNMEFFASSKNADKVRDEFNEKIAIANKELDGLKQQLRVLRSIE